MNNISIEIEMLVRKNILVALKRADLKFALILSVMLNTHKTENTIHFTTKKL
jgi:hypothetical protein